MIGLLNRRTLLSIKVILLIVLMNSSCFSQTTPERGSRCPAFSAMDIFKKKDTIPKAKPQKKNFFLILPIIGSQPATGFSYGFITQQTFKGKDPDDKYSVVNLGAVYTTKKQLLVNMKNNVFLDNNGIFLTGDYRFYIFSQPNYGLGTNIVPTNNDNPDFSIDSIAEPMDYNYIKFHQSISWEVTPSLYAGGGLDVDVYSKIVDKDLDVAAGEYTYHYNYSQKYGYNDLEYSVTGFSANLFYDSRDNQVNTSKGIYGHLKYRINPSVFKNQHASSVLYGELRYFLPLSKKNIQHVLGFWAYGQVLVGGRVPYLNLPAIGWDQRSRSGEGYTQGLFRGFDLAYFQAEYRFPITCNQLLGGAVFANFTTTSNKDNNVQLFDYIQPAVGVGLRLLIDKATRTNFIFDFAGGNGDSRAFYLNAGETF